MANCHFFKSISWIATASPVEGVKHCTYL